MLGQPIGHSRSPAMHTAALAELGLAGDWSYEAIELPPERFAAEVGEMPARGFVGANVTIPHKEAALELADRASDAARQIGAANTLSFHSGEIVADNTDAAGLLAALGDPPAGRRALVIGAGGAGRAAAWALRRDGASVSLWNRTAERAARVGAELDVEALPEGPIATLAGVDLLVNASAIGLATDHPPSQGRGGALKEWPFDVDQIGDRLVVVDLVYGGTETELVRIARESGARTIDGLEILVRQGAASFEIWTGSEAPLETMRQAVRQKSAQTDEHGTRTPFTPPPGTSRGSR